jgi:ribosome-associated protein
VELRFDAAGSPSLPEDLRARLLARRDRRITDEGVVVISAQRFRTQDRNRDDARERLAALIVAAMHVPKKRIATKPSRGAKERRLGAKRERSTIKSGRGSRWDRE